MVAEFCNDIEIIGAAFSVDEGIDLIREAKPDLLFLDIEMPGKNAFDLIDRLTPVNFEIIFVTAFEHYALKAFRYSAIDYLLKPVSIKELREAVEKARARIKERNKCLFITHCIAHRLALACNSAEKKVTFCKHTENIIKSIYNFFLILPKEQILYENTKKYWNIQF